MWPSEVGGWHVLSLGSDPCVGSLLGAACTKNLFVICVFCHFQALVRVHLDLGLQNVGVLF